MSIEVSSLVWKYFPGNGSVKLVMLALADWCNDEGGSLHPSMGAIAWKANISDKQARRIVKDLKDQGWISVVGNASGGSTTTHYRLNVSRLSPAFGRGERLFKNRRQAADSNAATGADPSHAREPSHTGQASHGRAQTPPTGVPDPSRPCPSTPPTGGSQYVIEPSIETLVETSEGAPEEMPVDRVEELFAYWKQVWNHPKAALDKDRRKRITKALEHYTVEDLKQVIVGYTYSPHHQGRNDTGTVYDDIELFFRDAKRIDAGMRFFRNPPRAPSALKSAADQNKNVIQAFLAKHGDSDFIEGQSQRVEDIDA